MLVELKNGETLNGHLVSCDTWMNLTLKEVVQTSPDGDKFFRLPEVYVRGNNVGGQNIHKIPFMVADSGHRSNIYEFQMRSSTWLRTNNRISPPVGDEGVCRKGAIMEGGEIAVEAA